MRRRKAAGPSLADAHTLKLIAIADGLMVTYVNGQPQYTRRAAS
jgi:hypothetical protein